jgi:hypothetical protein
MANTRKRKNIVKYTEKLSGSEGNEYREISSLNDIGETSSWDEYVVNCLNISVNNSDMATMFGPEQQLDDYATNLVLPQLSENMLNDISSIESATTNKRILTLLKKARDINVATSSVSIEEMYVDGFVNSLLSMMGFDEDPCGIYPQYMYSALFATSHTIGSKADFAVLSSMHTILLVIEDKTMNNARYTNNWREPQVIGELFVAAHKIVSSSTENNPVTFPLELYAIRVVGTKFTFYKSVIDDKYIRESATKRRLPLIQSMIVQRFPEIDNKTTYLNAFNFCEPSERKKLLMCMSAIRIAISQAPSERRRPH